MKKTKLLIGFLIFAAAFSMFSVSVSNGKTWREFQKEPRNSGYIEGNTELSENMNLLWSMTDVGGYGFWYIEGICFANMDSDKELELIITGTDSGYGTNGIVGVIDIDDNVLKWENNTNNGARVVPAVYDIINGIENEIILGQESGTRVYAYDNNGKVIWESSDLGDAIHNPAAVSDINNNGSLEIIQPESGLNILDNGGNLLWENNFNEIPDWGTVAVGDIQGDNKKEIVYFESHIQVYDSSGNLLWENSIGDSTNHGTCGTIADINNDGKNEIISGTYLEDTSGSLVVFDNGGNLLWTYDVGNMVTTAVAVGDIQGDNKKEIVFGGSTTFYALDSSGNLLWSFPDWTFPDRVNVAISNVVGDENKEIIFGGYSENMYILDNGGSELHKFTYDDAVHAVAVSDYNHDGIMEIAIGTDSSDVFVYSADKLKGKTVENVSVEIIKPIDGQDIQINEGFEFIADATGENLSYLWDFETGTSTEENGTYVYPSTGTYDISVTVESSSGLTASDSVTVNIVSSSTGSGGTGEEDTVEGGESDIPDSWEDPAAQEPGIFGIKRGLLLLPLFVIFGYVFPLWLLLLLLIIILIAHESESTDRLGYGMILFFVFLTINMTGVWS